MSKTPVRATRYFKDSDIPPPAGNIKKSIVERLFHLFHHELYQFLRRRLRSSEDAADAVQETFFRLWRREAQGRLESDARSYLFQTANNLVIDLDRKRRSRAEQDCGPGTPLESIDKAELSAQQSASWRQAVDELCTALASLEPLDRRVFLLYHARNMTSGEIAKTLGVTKRTVERQMSRALAHCKSHLAVFLEGD